MKSLRRTLIAAAMLLGLAESAEAWNQQVDPTVVSGHVGLFARRNYGSFAGVVAPVWGEEGALNVGGSVYDRRLARYNLGVNLLDGRSFATAERHSVLGSEILGSLDLLPLSWHRLGLFAGFGRLRYLDGVDWTDTTRRLGADLTLNAPLRWAPQAYARIADTLVKTNRVGEGGDRTLDASARLVKSVQANHIVDMSYDLKRSDQLRTDARYSIHQLYGGYYGRTSTGATLTVRASSGWYYADVIGDGTLLTRTSAFDAVWSAQLTPDDDLNIEEGSSATWAPGFSVVDNALRGLYYHNFAPWLRSQAGAEAAHTATDTTSLGFSYQKYREAVLGGAMLRVPAGEFVMFTPTYLGGFGGVQVTGGAGGGYTRHDASLPVLFGFAQTPMSIEGSLRVENDLSEVRQFRRFRALTARIDVINLSPRDTGSINSTLQLLAQQSRAESVLFSVRDQTDEQRAGGTLNTSVRPLASLFGLRYTYSIQKTLTVATTRTHAFAATWQYVPVASLLLNNTFEYLRSQQGRAGPESSIRYLFDASYDWRKLEFDGGFRYDKQFGAVASNQWGIFFQVRRRFQFGV